MQAGPTSVWVPTSEQTTRLLDDGRNYTRSRLALDSVDLGCLVGGELGDLILAGSATRCVQQKVMGLASCAWGEAREAQGSNGVLGGNRDPS